MWMMMVVVMKQQVPLCCEPAASLVCLLKNHKWLSESLGGTQSL